MIVKADTEILTCGMTV